MNVGDLSQDDKVNGQLILERGVGTIIVLGTRESRGQGEGSQSVGISEQR